MIEAIAKIGQIERERIKNKTSDDKDPQIVELIQNIYKPTQDDKRKQMLLKIILKQGEYSSYTFDRVELEDLKSDTCYKVLYRSAGGNALNPSPTAQITDKDTFGNKILKFFKEAKSNKEQSDEERKFFENVYNALTESENDIRKSIDEKSKEKGTYLLTITFEEGNSEKYLVDKIEFLDYFLEKVRGKEGRFKGNGVCSICGKSGEVYGGVFPYSFFNLDKEGFLNNFSKGDSYKNFPICKECIRDLETGKRFIEDKLNYTFVKGLRYRLIPQNISGDEKTFEELIDILSEQESEVDTKSLSRITDDENEILERLSKESDTFSLNFLFIEKQNKAEKILAFIQDVLPSRLNRIFEAKRKVDEVTKSIPGYDGKQFTFGYIREFFFKSDSQKSNPDLDKYFLDIVDKIFKDKKIDKVFLFDYLMNGIREEFLKEHSGEKSVYYFKTVDAFIVYLFLKELNIIDVKEVKMEERKFDVFFKRFEGVNDPVKKGLILLGAATETLLEIQEDLRGSKPFLKYLKSLKMTEKDFKELLTKVQAKLEEYDALPRAKDFLEEASYYLLMGGDNFKMSVPEMNFFFTLGMNLKREILKSIKEA